MFHKSDLIKFHCDSQCIADISRNLDENIRIQTRQRMWGPNFGNAILKKVKCQPEWSLIDSFWIVIENEIYCCAEPNFRHVNLIMKTVLRIGSH